MLLKGGGSLRPQAETRDEGKAVGQVGFELANKALEFSPSYNSIVFKQIATNITVAFDFVDRNFWIREKKEIPAVERQF